MKRKRIFILIALLLIIGSGWKVYIDKKEAKKIEVEKISIIALKNRYENIKSVEILKSGFDKKTGAFDLDVKMTNQNNESVDFTYTYWAQEKELGLDLMVNERVHKRGRTTNKVRVIYSNNEEEEI